MVRRCSRLDPKSGETARSIPPVPVIITKEHVNTVTRQIAGTTAYADGDVLQGTSAAQESRDAGRAYRERTFSRPKSS